MSDRKKDERLVELMTEFLEATDEDGQKESNGFNSPGLDNEKMLSAIDKHRAEIDSLKNQIEELKETIETVSEERDSVQHVVEAPEIIALQSTISSHSEQIEEILKQHKQFEGKIEEKKDIQLDDLNKLKHQVEELQDEVNRKQEESTVQGTVRPITPPEIIAVQNSITNHSSKIGDLEYKHKMLKTDVEREQDKNKKKTGFGLLGWLLLASNVLLWSVVGFFIWKYSNGTNKLRASEIVKVEEGHSSIIEEDSEQNYHEAETVVEKSTVALNESSQESEIFDEEVSDESIFNSDENAQLVNPKVGGVTPVINEEEFADLEQESEAKSPAVKAKKAVYKPKAKRKTEAQKYFERMAAEKKNNKSNAEIAKQSSANQERVSQLNNSDANSSTTDQPDVQFGD